jgi:hypothetical protein
MRLVLIEPDLRALFVTGFAENAAVGNGHLEPGMEVITKPFVMTELANKITNMIGGGTPVCEVGEGWLPALNDRQL